MELVMQALVGILLLVIVGLVLYVTYLLIRRNRFTRERFAFAALWANGTAFLAVLTTVTGPEPVWQTAINIAAEAGGFTYRSSPATASDKILAVLLYGIMVYAAWQIFRNWDGLQSARQLEQGRGHLPPSLIREGLFETRRLILRHPPPGLAAGYRYAGFSRITPPTDSLAWRDRARELAEITRPDLRFNATDPWHADHNLWVGEHRHTSTLIGVWCTDYFTNLAQTAPLLAYLQQLAIDRNYELMVFAQDEAVPGGTVNGVTVTTHTEAQLLDNLVDFSDYIRQTENRVGLEPLPDSDLTVDDIYVPSQVRVGPDSDDAVVTDDLVTYLQDWQEEPGQRQLAVLGTYGQGKSTSMMVFARNTLRRIKSGERIRIPVFIELRGKSPATLLPLELLAHWSSLYRIDPRAMLILLKAGRLTLIFDGFDEMAESGTAEARVGHFASLWRLCHPKAKIVFTGRPHFLLDDTEVKATLGVEQGSGTGPYCEALHLAPFNRERIIASLRAVSETVRDGILSLEERSAQFRDVVARPSLLYAVTRIWNLPEVQSHRDSLNSGVILSLFVRHSYRRQSEKQRDERQFMAMSEAERGYFMMGVAAHMAHNALTNQIERADLEAVVGRLYQTIPDILPAESLALPGDEARRPLKERLNDDKDALEKIITNVRAYGILENDPARIGTYRFGHKSFYEVLFAQYLKECLFAKNTKMTIAIRSATGATIVDHLKVPLSMRMCFDLTRAIGLRTRSEIDEYFFGKSKFDKIFANFLEWVLEKTRDEIARDPEKDQSLTVRITPIDRIFYRLFPSLSDTVTFEAKVIFRYRLCRSLSANPACPPNLPPADACTA